MKKMLRLVAALAVLAGASSAAAQERPQLGFGISIDTFANVGVPTIEVYVPLTVGPQLRIEPSVGIFTQDPSGGGVETSDLTLGVGVFFMNRVAPETDMYVGGRLKLNFASSDNGVVDDSDTDIILAGAIGGEYYLAPKFSLGAEAQLGLYSRGDVRGDDSGFFTTGLAFLRVYF